MNGRQDLMTRLEELEEINVESTWWMIIVMVVVGPDVGEIGGKDGKRSGEMWRFNTY